MWVQPILFSIFAHTYTHTDTQRHTHIPPPTHTPVVTVCLTKLRFYHRDFSVSDFFSLSTILLGIVHRVAAQSLANLGPSGHRLPSKSFPAGEPQCKHPYVLVLALPRSTVPGVEAESADRCISHFRKCQRDDFQRRATVHTCPSPVSEVAAFHCPSSNRCHVSTFCCSG